MRLAVYAAPTADTAFWRRGSAWLGFDAAAGEAVAQPVIEGMAVSRLAELTQDAARYGWHATLKAPFALACGADAKDVLDAVSQLAARFTAFDVPLALGELAGFLALRPAGETGTLAELSAAATVALAPFTASLSEDEIERRSAKLDRRRQELTARWGYPHLFEHFRFHFTLAAPCTLEEQTTLAEAARRHFGERPVFRLDALTVFAEPEPGEPFRLLARAPFGDAR
ncbi:DUF1045 domain-containing protein [Crenobacter cavernae]|uniref:DUF1045 domain-containing protein n=1 Tax=Crenobacter cavernae TaxID=2290923 RepID=A0ABY0FJ95_9NEIS|nr:DUF1045 domain-containing protein [Crenobacter cavernae]RXZ45667.1 DUF1045 domain-containing protein [Crenobacter cavernae]